MQTLQLGRLIPFGYGNPGSTERLQELMTDKNTIIIETRYTPYAPYRIQWNRWGKKGLFNTYDPRYYYFSEKSYGDGSNDLNWLGNRNYKQPELGIQLVNPEQGIKYVVMGLERGQNVILLCGCKAYESCHRRIICELVAEKLPEVEIVLR